MNFLFITICLSLFFIFLPFSNNAQAITHPVNGQKESQDKEELEIHKELAADDFLGKDIDFPFRPENHRDNSSSIRGIR